jgi:hypothetical protein
MIVLLLTRHKEGTEIWVAAENAYNERVSRVENQIIARLRDRLGTARNANEMFRVFSKFNALFVRPKVNKQNLFETEDVFENPFQIRGAIQEYQTQLIDSVKEDIKRLHEKVTQSFIVPNWVYSSQTLSSKHNIVFRKPTICHRCAIYRQSRVLSFGRVKSSANCKHT